MLPHIADEALAVSFLLGRLGDEERERADARLFADDEFFDLVRLVEEGLIRDHLRGRLDPDSETLFRREYLTNPLLCEKVRVAAAIVNAAQNARGGRDSPAGGARPWYWEFRWGIAAAWMLLALPGALLLWRNSVDRRFESQIAGLRDTQRRIEESAGRPQADRVLTSFEFSAGLLPRDATRRARILTIPAGDGLVVFQLQPDPGVRAARYRAAITTAEGSEVWSAVTSGDSARTGFVEITVPASVFHRADYIAILDDVDGGSAHSSYTFRVER